MNRAQILRDLRQLVQDVRDFKDSPITADTSSRLLRSVPGAMGGELVKWFNQEPDPRQRLYLRDAIKLVANYHANPSPDAAGNLVSKLPILCSRIESSSSELNPNDVAILCEMASRSIVESTPATRTKILHNWLRWTEEGKRAFDNLKALGYVKSAGKRGYYLTAEGQHAASKLQ